MWHSAFICASFPKFQTTFTRSPFLFHPKASWSVGYLERSVLYLLGFLKGVRSGLRGEQGRELAVGRVLPLTTLSGVLRIQWEEVWQGPWLERLMFRLRQDGSPFKGQERSSWSGSFFQCLSSWWMRSQQTWDSSPRWPMCTAHMYF